VDVERSTRQRVVRAVLQSGPVTAADLATELGITPAAVRRHLDALVLSGQVQARGGASSGHRGRPARTYVHTRDGHATAPGAYDDLAASALGFLARTEGQEAVARFARVRAGELEERYAAAVADAPDVAGRVRALAGALTADGFAASARPVRAGPVEGVQLCQGHCPVESVASAFPELCRAEAEAFERLLGAPVQRLATLATGSHACTTHVTTQTEPQHQLDPLHPTAPPEGTDPR